MSLESKVLSVEGMSCTHCENSVIKSLRSLNGVIDVVVSLNEKKVTVEYDMEKISLHIIRETIEDQGYNVK